VSKEPQLLRKLESYIEMLGKEFAEKSDARFIGEFSLQAELAHILWKDKKLWCRVPLDRSGPVVELPRFYAEWYAAGNKRFDFALLDRSTIKEWSTRIRHILPGFHEEAAKLPVLAAIEIKGKDYISPWREEIRKDLDKLIKSIEEGQVKHGYLLIFYDALKHTPNWKAFEAYIAGMRKELEGQIDKDLKVYYASCGNPSIPARWI